MRRICSLTSALLLTVFLVACESSEERAEEHYQNAVSLLAEDDADRAIVELRNVFQLVPNHLEARHLLAEVLLVNKDRPREAYSQYLRLVEQYPDDLKARVELAQLAFFSGNWPEMSRHGEKAREIAPDDNRVQKIGAALDYRDSIEAEDEPKREAIVERAKTLLDPVAPGRLLRELILDDALRQQEFTKALAILDEMTDEFPDQERLWRQRLQVLIALGDETAIENQLVDLVNRFPNDIEQKRTLTRYYLARGELDKTEAFLRGLITDATEDRDTARIDLIRFLTEFRNLDVARAEISTAISEATDASVFVMMGASLDFAGGNREKAIKDLENAIAEAEPSESTNAMKVGLARMLLTMGNEVGARALVEAVLAEEETNVGALKMNASWLIEADEIDDAISALRIALDTSPSDAEAMTLMAGAYSRNGSNDLARDFLALAAEESGNAPEETIRYAQLLISESRYLPAEDVLLPALRIAPNNIDLLRVSGQLYLEMNDLGRMQQVIDTLRRLETTEANRIAVQLEALRLNQTSGIDDAMQYLEGLANAEDGDAASKILLLRARLSTGDFDGAIELAENLVAEEPDAPAQQLILATTKSAAGDIDGAMEIYQSLLEQYPNETGLLVEISSLQIRSGNPEGARQTISEALQSSPEDPRLLWANASYLEVDGDIAGAIEIYERMYALDSNSIVVANNLASLIGTYLDDEESLERAWTISRRFRDAELPAIQDTYGWLTHRRGDSQDALPYLQSAAAVLSEDPIVQFHLAEVYYALDRREDALEQYRKVLSLAGVGDTRAQIETTRARLAEIETSVTGSD